MAVQLCIQTTSTRFCHGACLLTCSHDAPIKYPVGSAVLCYINFAKGMHLPAP